MNETGQIADDPVQAEALRLLRSLLHVKCSAGRKWNIETCRLTGPGRGG